MGVKKNKYVQNYNKIIQFDANVRGDCDVKVMNV